MSAHSVLRSFDSLVGPVLGLTLLVAPLMAQHKAPLPLEMERPIVGIGIDVNVRPRMRQSVELSGTLLWSEALRSPGASFLKAHFADVNMAPGDVLVVRDQFGGVIEEISGRGPKNQGSFWGLSVFGDEILLEFQAAEPYTRLPFRIDQVILGDPGIFTSNDSGRSICTPADFEDVVCYQGDADKWANVRASVGVMSVGGNPVTALFCSGSNVSPNNYILTNDHCVSTEAECDSTEFVFKYYRTGCNDGSPTTLDWQSYRCDEIVANSPVGNCDASLVDLDFSLCSVIGDPASTYGYARPSADPVIDGEGLYIIQHPNGRPHEIAHGSGANVDADGTVLRYYDTLDTEGGSSGSPIFRESDDALIGLHHCGGCSTAGTGNRGMLMRDIYPMIQDFLCTDTLEVTLSASANRSELSGNGDAIMDPGEVWQFVPSVRNTACSKVARDVKGTIQVNPATTASITLFTTSLEFGDIPASDTRGPLTPIAFLVDENSPCGSRIVLDLVNLTVQNAPDLPDELAFVNARLGANVLEPSYSEDFATGGPLWSVIDGGVGTGAAATWTTTNPGGRALPLLAPYFIVDSDEQGSGNQMDEELISPPLDATGYARVKLQFTHDFNWYSGGLDEQADVDVRSSATGGAWVTVANYSGADASGTVTIDITSQAKDQIDVEVRFHYYDADFEWWWAIDDVTLLGSNGLACNPVSSGYLNGPRQPR